MSETNSLADSRITADSFFGGTGGQRVDTRDSMFQSGMYSSSQLNANDVDPLAEADVYLAYGRDIQAEEILKEAIRAQPDRHAVRVKLLEIYAKRRDARSFEVFATELYSMTQGQGADWAKAMELGRELEPTNPLYSGGGASSIPQSQPNSIAFNSSQPSPFDAPPTVPSSRPMEYSSDATSRMTREEISAEEESIDIDLDLDFSAAPAAATVEQAAAGPNERTMKLDLNAMSATGGFVEPTVKMQATAGSAASQATVKLSAADLAPEDNGLSFEAFAPVPPAPAPVPSVPAAATTSSEPMDLQFDMGGISLDLDINASSANGAGEDAFDTKFALAEECRKLGDKESARQILREILAAASGSVKSRAERLLNELA